MENIKSIQSTYEKKKKKKLIRDGLCKYTNFLVKHLIKVFKHNKKVGEVRIS